MRRDRFNTVTTHRVNQNADSACGFPTMNQMPGWQILLTASHGAGIVSIDGEMNMIDILLVDDYAAVRAGLRMRLSLEPDLHVIGEAHDGINAINLARHLGPQLIIMDAVMPEMDGISAARHLKAEAIDSEIIILTTEDTQSVYESAKNAGVAAVFAKNAAIDQLISAIRAIMSRRHNAVALA